MSSADIVGDAGELTDSVVVAFSAVHTQSDAGGNTAQVGSFDLTEAQGLKHLPQPYAKCELVGPLKCEVIGPAAPDKATTTYIAVIPNNTPATPDRSDQILTIAGAITARQSLYATASPQTLQ